MGDVTRTKLSRKNSYYLEKHRYLELKNFCLQYDVWQKAHDALLGLKSRPADLLIFSENIPDPTARCAEAIARYSAWMDLVRKAAITTDKDLADYIFKGVTEGKSYDVLCAKERIPCCREKYYELYRKFFWILSQLRD